MMLFSIEFEGGLRKYVFAQGVHQAAGYFITWQMANDRLTSSFVLDRVTIGSKSGQERDHLRDALSWEIEGIATYDETAGWHIRPVEDERQ